jgi:hypothetical protein
MIWSGPRHILDTMLADMNTLADGMRITNVISNTDVDFLDLHFFKGSIWLQSSHLDVKLFAKASNAYLYKTFDSSAPRSQFIGVIYGELIRLIKRNSDPANFHTDATALYSRLQARGYPPRFLDLHFSTAPNWSSRQRLLLKNSALQPDTGSPPDRVHVLALPYSRVLETTQVAHVIHEHATLLPPHLTEGRHLVAWKAASRIGDSLTTYRLTNDD